MADQTQCRDCDGVKIFANEGDGKCSVCHGDGRGGILDQVADGLNPWDVKTGCWKCHGTGQCQSCGGTGLVY